MTPVFPRGSIVRIRASAPTDDGWVRVTNLGAQAPRARGLPPNHVLRVGATFVVAVDSPAEFLGFNGAFVVLGAQSGWMGIDPGMVEIVGGCPMLTSETARALVAAPGWRWLPGMRWTAPVRPGGYGPEGNVGRCSDAIPYPDDPDAIPDLDDPVTAAALVVVARLAYREPTLHTEPRVDGFWGIACVRSSASTPLCYLWTDGEFHGCGAVRRTGLRLMRRTEVEVLIAAILAAPGVDR